MKKKKQKKTLLRKKNYPDKSDQKKLVQHVKIVIKFCCRIMQLSQTKLFNKKKGNAWATGGWVRCLKKQQYTYEKKKKKIRENTPSWFLICNIIDC